MFRQFYIGFIIIFLLSSFHVVLLAEKNEEQPPALVVVSEITSGMIRPITDFIGTVTFPYISDVASEVNGKADLVEFEEGQRVGKDEVLVKIDAELLIKNIKVKKALLDQVLSELELALLDRKRIEELYRKEAVSEQAYDEQRFKVIGLQNKAASIRAELEGLEVELRKKTIKAPFNGVVIKKHVEVGEWLSPGTTVATIARDDIVDIVVHVPEKVCRYLRQETKADLTIGGESFRSKVFAVIPSGDIATRSFPVKIRTKNPGLFMSGMEAKVSLPHGEQIKTLLVNRDAIINRLGNNIIFIVHDSQVKQVPVNVLGYSGTMAGIEGTGLKEGIEVVIRGNERLHDGQMVHVKPKRKRSDSKRKRSESGAKVQQKRSEREGG